MTDSVEQELRALILEDSGLPDEFSRQADLYLELGLPSIRALQLLQACEEKFNVQIPDDQFVEATSLEKLTQLIVSLRGA